MRSQRRNGGRPCRMRTVWFNCDFYVRWYKTYLLLSFEDAFQAWFDAISDKRLVQRYNFARQEWEVRCCIPGHCEAYTTLVCTDVERGPGLIGPVACKGDLRNDPQDSQRFQ